MLVGRSRSTRTSFPFEQTIRTAGTRGRSHRSQPMAALLTYALSTYTRREHSFQVSAGCGSATHDHGGPAGGLAPARDPRPRAAGRAHPKRPVHGAAAAYCSPDRSSAGGSLVGASRWSLGAEVAVCPANSWAHARSDARAGWRCGGGRPDGGRHAAAGSAGVWVRRASSSVSRSPTAAPARRRRFKELQPKAPVGRTSRARP